MNEVIESKLAHYEETLAAYNENKKLAEKRNMIGATAIAERYIEKEVAYWAKHNLPYIATLVGIATQINKRATHKYIDTLAVTGALAKLGYAVDDTHEPVLLISEL